jgi:hypothetical protein
MIMLPFGVSWSIRGNSLNLRILRLHFCLLEKFSRPISVLSGYTYGKFDGLPEGSLSAVASSPKKETEGSHASIQGLCTNMLRLIFYDLAASGPGQICSGDRSYQS